MIRASGLVKRYGEVTALDGLDLEVPEGSVLALLGPNGAGKTTAVRILTTLLRPDEGRAEVAGLDVLHGHQGHGRHRMLGGAGLQLLGLGVAGNEAGGDHAAGDQDGDGGGQRGTRGLSWHEQGLQGLMRRRAAGLRHGFACGRGRG